MLTIELDQTPVQALSATIDARRYEIAVRFAGLVISVDIARDGVQLVTGMRAVAGTPLLPYLYLEDQSGNFTFTTADDALPDYTRFGIDQFLIYASNAELEAIRAGA